MKKFAMIFMLWPIFFFGAGLWEMSKAKETAGWPAIPAKITSFQILKGHEGGGYVSIEGKFLDTGGTFTVKRYAYGAVNGLSPSQPYLAPYKPGYVTTVYVDPKDPNNVILCNNPSLTGNYMLMGGSVLAVLGILWWLIFKSKKKAEPYVPPYAPVQRAQTKELPRWAALLIGFGMLLLFLGLGIWMIYMGMVGHSQAEKWNPNQSKIVICMGMLFVFGGLMGLMQAIYNGNPPSLLNKIILSLFLVFLGLPFIAVAIFDPGGIHSSASVGGFVVHESKGSPMGAVVFMLVGIGCMVGAFWPWRWWKK